MTWPAPVMARSATSLAAPESRALLIHTRDDVLDGAHWRLPTERGVIHVWIPAAFQEKTAGIAIYAHGYTTSADRSWTTSRLAAQFHASGRNAVFIVPDGPQGEGQALVWPRLDELLATVSTGIAMRLPSGPAIILGHSSGFRTLVGWMGDPRVREVILLDGFYGRHWEFAAWLLKDPSRRLMLVAARSRPMADRWVQSFTQARQLAYVPRYPGELTEEERAAPLLYLQSQYEHAEMIHRPVVIPLVLKLARGPAQN